MLAAQGLSKRYRKREVVKDFGFELAPGEVVGLLGPNGAGKTTCFYMVVGLVPSDGGRILLDGEDIAALPMHLRARRGIGYLPQEASVFRSLSAADNVRAALELRPDLSPEQREAELGKLLAEGFDAVCFLDADNWFEQDHVAACVAGALDGSRPDYVIARRRFVRMDASVLPLQASEDDLNGHVDTSCLFLLRGAFHTIARWATMPRPLAGIGDRVYAATLRSEGLRCVRIDRVTVNYLCTWASLFRQVGEDPPAYAKPNVDPTPAIEWWKSARAEADGIVDRLIGAPIAPD